MVWNEDIIHFNPTRSLVRVNNGFTNVNAPAIICDLSKVSPLAGTVDVGLVPPQLNRLSQNSTLSAASTIKVATKRAHESVSTQLQRTIISLSPSSSSFSSLIASPVIAKVHIGQIPQQLNQPSQNSTSSAAPVNIVANNGGRESVNTQLHPTTMWFSPFSLSSSSSSSSQQQRRPVLIARKRLSNQFVNRLFLAHPDILILRAVSIMNDNCIKDVNKS